MEYTKEMFMQDLEYKLKEIEDLKKGLAWTLEQYKKGILPD